MSQQSTTVAVPVQSLGIPQNACFTNFQELLSLLQQYLVVQVPRSISNVIISNTQPTSAERNSLWVRENNGGQFIGIYVYDGTTWRQVLPTPNGIFKMYGDSRSIPEGFLLADASNPHISADMAMALELGWVRDNTDTYWEMFDVTFEGL